MKKILLILIILLGVSACSNKMTDLGDEEYSGADVMPVSVFISTVEFKPGEVITIDHIKPSTIYRFQYDQMDPKPIKNANDIIGKKSKISISEEQVLFYEYFE